MWVFEALLDFPLEKVGSSFFDLDPGEFARTNAPRIFEELGVIGYARKVIIEAGPNDFTARCEGQYFEYKMSATIGKEFLQFDSGRSMVVPRCVFYIPKRGQNSLEAGCLQYLSRDFEIRFSHYQNAENQEQARGRIQGSCNKLPNTPRVNLVDCIFKNLRHFFDQPIDKLGDAYPGDAFVGAEDWLPQERSQFRVCWLRREFVRFRKLSQWDCCKLKALPLMKQGPFLLALLRPSSMIHARDDKDLGKNIW